MFIGEKDPAERDESVILDPIHRPVLLKEAVDFLAVRRGGFYVDATLGQAGHALEIIRRGGQVLGIELNPETQQWLNANVKSEELTVVNGNFANLGQILDGQTERPIDGILFDLGLSTFELESSGRGFSYLRNEPLDLRFDPESNRLTAAQLVNLSSPEELYEIFTKFGEIRNAFRLSQSLVRRRALKKIVTTFDLVTLVETAFLPKKGRRDYRLLSQVFQALRIVVNDELLTLAKGLESARDRLRAGGRVVVISFHSLEDRLVKKRFREWWGENKGRLLTKLVVTPTRLELSRNPAARSARLRAFEKIL